MKSLSASTSNKIKLLSFIGAILVITIHTYNISVYSIECTSFLNCAIYFLENLISKNIARIAVPFFFMFSSFFFFYKIQPNKEWFIRKYKKRIHSLLIPYLIWNLVGYFIFLLPYFTPTLRSLFSGYISDPSIMDFLQALFLYKYNYVFWFVYDLILFVLASPIVYLLLRNKIIGAIATLTLMILWLFNVTIRWEYFPNPSCLFFCFLGSYVAIHYENFNSEFFLRKVRINKGILLMLWLVLIIINIKHNNIVFSNICILFGILVVWRLLDSVAEKISIGKFINCSFMIYALHPFILEIFEKIILKLLGIKPIFALIDYIVAPCLTLFIIFLIIYLMKKFVPSLYNIISGGR